MRWKPLIRINNTSSAILDIIRVFTFFGEWQTLSICLAFQYKDDTLVIHSSAKNKKTPPIYLSSDLYDASLTTIKSSFSFEEILPKHNWLSLSRTFFMTALTYLRSEIVVELFFLANCNAGYFTSYHPIIIQLASYQRLVSVCLPDLLDIKTTNIILHQENDTIFIFCISSLVNRNLPPSTFDTFSISETPGIIISTNSGVLAKEK